MAIRKSYSDAEKLHAIRYLVLTGKTVAEVSKELGVCDSTMRKWKNSLEEKARTVQDGRTAMELKRAFFKPNIIFENTIKRAYKKSVIKTSSGVTFLGGKK